MPGYSTVNDEVCPHKATVLPVSHITASLTPYNKLTWKTVHENLSPCDSWWASGLLNITFLGQLDQRSGNSSGIRMGIVPIAFAGHCAELTARPAEAKPRPQPRGSPIKMCRNARRKITGLDPQIRITASLHCPSSCSLDWSRICLLDRRDSWYFNTIVIFFVHSFYSKEQQVNRGENFIHPTKWNLGVFFDSQANYGPLLN